MKKRLSLVLHFAKPHGWKFALLLLCILVTSLMNAAYPYLLGQLVDEVFYEKNMSRFIGIMLAYGGVFLLGQILHFGLNMSWASLMTYFLNDIRTALYSKTLSLQGLALTNLQTGDIIKRMNEDSDQFMNFIHWNVFYSLGATLDALMSAFLIFMYNWKLGLMALVLVPIVVFLSRIFAARAKKMYAELNKKNGVLFSWLFEVLNAMADIRVLHAGRRVLALFTHSMVDVYHLKAKSVKNATTAERVGSGISLLATLCLYAVSAVLIAGGQLRIGGFVAVLTFFGKLTADINSLGNKAVDIAENMAGIERVQELLEETSEDYNENLPDLKVRGGRIEFSDISFEYQSGLSVLNGFSVKIDPGTHLALVGESGAGKTTFASLLMRFYTPSEGKIYIDGQDVAEYNLHSVRNNIGIVHQDIILFGGTLRYNLIFSDDISRDEELIAVLQRAHLGNFFASLPEGLDTLVGDAGQGISGGQKQRLAIARVFLKNPPIIVFDEATSALDSEAETAVNEALNKMSNERTVITIAHRLSTVLSADTICVIKNGRVVGYGCHEELLQNNKVYTDLFARNFEVMETSI